MGKYPGRPKAKSTIEARRITVNAIVEGNQVTLFNGRGQRLAKVSLASLEDGDDSELCADWKWRAMIQIYLWRLKQQMWKAGQNPWMKKATKMAHLIRTDRRRRNGKTFWRERGGRPTTNITTTWGEAFVRMARHANAVTKPNASEWMKWCYRRAAIFYANPRTGNHGSIEHAES